VYRYPAVQTGPADFYRALNGGFKTQSLSPKRIYTISPA
jgi:hypothetical protein